MANVGMESVSATDVPTEWPNSGLAPSGHLPWRVPEGVPAKKLKLPITNQKPLVEARVDCLHAHAGRVDHDADCPGEQRHEACHPTLEPGHVRRAG